jgi:hypothetical protein
MDINDAMQWDIEDTCRRNLGSMAEWKFKGEATMYTRRPLADVGI